jgi:hypothetical protein
LRAFDDMIERSIIERTGAAAYPAAEAVALGDLLQERSTS